jgi:hypothetical protein
MNAGEVDMKERISMVRKEYAVLKEDMKLDECGWSRESEIRQVITFFISILNKKSQMGTKDLEKLLCFVIYVCMLMYLEVNYLFAHLLGSCVQVTCILPRRCWNGVSGADSLRELNPF